ncbi:MAG: C-type lectin domain-containing protein [Magnetococcus sp. DMHC-6]
MKTTRILAICGLFALLAVGNAQAATTGEFNGHTYTYVDTKMTWTEAKANCESIRAHLATITSQEEDNFVYNFIIENGGISSWFGASDAESEGTWKWITGEPWNYTNWHTSSGEPNNSGDEDYLSNYSNLIGWNDDKYYSIASSICESETTPLTVPHSFTPSTTIKSSEVNENFDTIYQKYNDLLLKYNDLAQRVTTLETP